jgi:hypothetical protein
MSEGYLLNARAIATLKKDHQLLHSQLSMLRAGVAASPNNTIRLREEAVIVKVTEIITPRSTTQLGSGKAEVWNIDEDGKLEDAQRDELEVYNDSLVPILVDSYIRVSRNFRSGFWLPTAEVQTIIGYAENGVSARSGTTAGSATIKVYYLLSGVLTDSGETITGYNIADVAIGAASYVMLKKGALSENWFIDFAEC